MNIVIGSIQQETNTFSPIRPQVEDFEFYEGAAIFEKLPIRRIFEQARAHLIPTIYANTLPSGPVPKSVFDHFKSKLISRIPKSEKIDGVWLYLHGAMEVEGIGSGEEAVVRSIRDVVGKDAVISVALDFHANLTEQFLEMVDIVRGYRTAPHVDQVETQIDAANLLIACLQERLRPVIAFCRPPLILTGDMVTTEVDPMKTLIDAITSLGKEEEILTASLFNGQPWVDAPNTMACVVVVAKSDEAFAQQHANRIAEQFWNERRNFRFEERALFPEEALATAIKSAKRPVFISDSGDNVTAGAPGDRTSLLRLLLTRENLEKRVLIAAIQNSAALKALSTREIDDETTIHLEGPSPPREESLTVAGRVTAHGRGRGINNEETGPTAVFRTGNIDIIVAAGRSAFIFPMHFKESGVGIEDYDIIVVKLGYLFPDLRRASAESILALTPGASTEDISSIPFRRIVHPIYPCDNDFNWSPLGGTNR